MTITITRPATRGARRAALLLSTMLGACALSAAPAWAQAAGDRPAPPLDAPASPVAADAPADDPQNSERDIIVTGSALPTTPGQAAVPITVIGADDIKKGGVDNNVLELVRKQIPSFAGRSNTGNSNANNTNQNTAGGSQAQLRNLDTLVLVNGRRMAVNAIAGMGGKVFVDLAQIPAAAIERVEVLTDGASAIYGSDAVGGVINFILKSNYEGIAVDGRYGFADGYKERSASFTFGHNLKDGFNITMAGTYLKSDPLFQNQRSFTSPFYSTSTAVPGSVVNSGLFGVLANGLTSPSQRNPTGVLATAPNFAALVANGTYVNTPTTISPQTTPPNANSNIGVVGTGIGGTYDLSRFQTLLLQQEQKAFDIAINADIVPGITFFADAQLADNLSFTQFRPVTVGVTLPQGSPFNPVAGALGGVTFGSTANPKRYYNHNESLRVTAGLKGHLEFLGPTWSYEAAYVHSTNRLFQRQENVIFAPNVALAIAGGYDASGAPVAGGAFSRVYSSYSTAAPMVLVPALDPLSRGPANPATINALFGTEQIRASSTLDSIDGSLRGKLIQLPGGGLEVAIGANHRRESLSGQTDPNGYVHANPDYCNNGGTFVNNPTPWIGGQQADPFPVACTSATPGSRGRNSRTITAEYIESRIPIFGDGFTIPGFDEFDLIGAVRHERYSDAGSSTVPKIGFFWRPLAGGAITFRGSYSKSFTAPPLYQEYGPTNFRLAGPGIVPAAFPGLAAGLTPVQDGVNPGLKPAKADSYSIGVRLKPPFMDNLKIGVDYSFVKESGLPGGIGFSNIFLDVNQNGAASIFSGNIAKGNFPGQPGATAFANPGDLRAYLAADPANYANVFAIDRFTNLGGIRVKTLNGTIDYSLPTERFGTFSFSSILAVFLSYKFQALPTQKFYEYAGTATNGGTGVQGLLPKFRSYSQINWTYHDLDFTIGNTYVSAVRDLGAGGITYETNSTKAVPTAFAGRIKPYTTFDLRLGYTLRDMEGAVSGVSLAVGVNNVFNRMPPVSSNVFTPSAAYSDNTADTSTYSPIGRLGYVQATVKF